MITVLFSIGCGLFIGHCIGWVSAHKMVEKECERLGCFFVGKKVFYCTKIADTCTPKELLEGLGKKHE